MLLTPLQRCCAAAGSRLPRRARDVVSLQRLAALCDGAGGRTPRPLAWSRDRRRERLGRRWLGASIEGAARAPCTLLVEHRRRPRCPWPRRRRAVLLRPRRCRDQTGDESRCRGCCDDRNDLLRRTLRQRLLRSQRPSQKRSPRCSDLQLPSAESDRVPAVGDGVKGTGSAALPRSGSRCARGLSTECHFVPNSVDRPTPSHQHFWVSCRQTAR